MIKVKVNFKKTSRVKVVNKGTPNKLMAEFCAVCPSVILSLSKGDKEKQRAMWTVVTKAVTAMIEEEDKYVQRVRSL